MEVTAQEVKTDLEKFAEVDETISWSMKFPSGVMASVMTTYGFNGANFFTATCKGGRFGMDPAYSYDGLKGWTSKPDVKIAFPAVDHFATEMDAFAEAVMANAPFHPAGEEGLRDLLVIEAIYRSIKEGRTAKVG